MYCLVSLMMVVVLDVGTRTLGSWCSIVYLRVNVFQERGAVGRGFDC